MCNLVFREGRKCELTIQRHVFVKMKTSILFDNNPSNVLLHIKYSKLFQKLQWMTRPFKVNKTNCKKLPFSTPDSLDWPVKVNWTQVHDVIWCYTWLHTVCRHTDNLVGKLEFNTYCLRFESLTANSLRYKLLDMFCYNKLWSRKKNYQINQTGAMCSLFVK